MPEGIIAIDKTGSHTSGIVKEQEANILLSGDSYFYNFLNSKVRLTELGLYILNSIKGVSVKFEMPVDNANQYDLTSFNAPTMP
jgi:hypothetical protein